MSSLVCYEKKEKIAHDASFRKVKFPKDNMDTISGTGGYECCGMDALLTLNAKELSH